MCCAVEVSPRIQERDHCPTIVVCLILGVELSFLLDIIEFQTARRRWQRKEVSACSIVALNSVQHAFSL